jgi:transglutaminase-like putative cysteine protease
VTTIEISHRTRFVYTRSIPSSYNEARVMPQPLPRQRVLAASVEIDPVTWQMSYTDYWETRVTVFEVLRPHRELTVTATSRVEVLAEPAPARACGWEELGVGSRTDRLAEFLEISPTTQPEPDLAAYAREAARTRGPDETARAICAHLHETVRYVPGATTVHTPAAQAWLERSGVCQDFAHLALGALRSVGIPARYVSGYLHPSKRSQVGRTVRGESHAWVEWWVGDWVGYDPTNDAPVSDHHVVVARAREYADVMPLKGVFTGGESELAVSVEVTQVA